jgi:hypothetical protein
MSKPRPIPDYVLVCDSADRLYADVTEPNLYTLSWPKIAPGKYRVEVSITENSATNTCGYCLRSSSVINHLSTSGNTLSYKLIMTFDKFRSIGHFYVQDPEGTFDVKILDLTTGDVGDVDEHIVMFHMTKIGSQD